MHSPIITTLFILLLYNLLAAGTPANPDESLNTPAAIGDPAESDQANGVHTLNERHKRHEEWKHEDVRDYSGNYKRQVDDELFAVPEEKREYNHDIVTRTRSVGGQHEQRHIKTVPLVSHTKPSRRDYHDEAVTRVHGGGKRHEHHHTTTSDPPTWNDASTSAEFLRHKASADSYASVEVAGQSELAVAVAEAKSNGNYRRQEPTITSAVQQAKQSCDATCQSAHENQERDVGNEDTRHDQSHEPPSSPNLPTPMQTPTPSVVKRHKKVEVNLIVKPTESP